MKKVLSLLRYSGLWIGIVVNPMHWQFRLTDNRDGGWNTCIFDSTLHLGLVTIRLTIDDGRW